MADPLDARSKLNELAQRLGKLSEALVDVNRALEPVHDEYTQFIDDFETGLWLKHVQEGAKLPPKDLRVQLAHKAMPVELLGRHKGLTNSRERLMKRISDLRVEVEAQRSLLSAWKTEMEATR